MDDLVWRNWAGTETCRPQAIIKAESVEQVSEVVADATRRGVTVRPVGSSHSFAPLIPTDGILLDVSALSGIVSIDTDNQRATVRAGTSISALGEPLWDAGLTLSNQGAIDAQTIAGATATSTHGSGLGQKMMSGGIVGAEIVKADGEVEELGADDPRLPALRISMGTLGVIVSLDLQLEPIFKLAETLEFRPFGEVLDRWDELAHAHRHFSLIYGPMYDMSAVMPAVPDGMPNPTLVRIYDKVDVGSEDSDVATRRVNRPYRIYPDVYSAESPWEEIEPHVPYTSALDAIGACLPLLERFPDDYPLDVRTIAGDDGWLSPSQGQESISINLSRTYRKDNGPFYRAVEEALAPFPGRGRPHWGKQPHLRTADFYREIYPRWDEFIALRRQLDPTGTFLNEALRGLLE